MFIWLPKQERAEMGKKWKPYESFGIIRKRLDHILENTYFSYILNIKRFIGTNSDYVTGFA